jgi:folate-dependent phosphoribosylglycinamide formyltransferase PurN
MVKTLMLCADRPNHRALANRLHAVHQFTHIGLVEPIPPRQGPSFASRIASATIGRPLRRAWKDLFEYYDRITPNYPAVSTSRHKGVNSTSVQTLIENEKPDLVIISGTDLLRAPLIDAIGCYGSVINLHTGISPYLKGAPNCTNWALSLGEFDLIGNSIMWLDAGIDSGSLICTERTPLTGRESLSELHRAVMDHAHDLYQRAYRLFVAGQTLPAISQREMGAGRLLLSRHWNALAILRAMYNFSMRFSPQAIVRTREIALVTLDSVETASKK